MLRWCRAPPHRAQLLLLAAALLAACAARPAALLSQSQQDDALIGWRGESYKPADPGTPGGASSGGPRQDAAAAAGSERRRWVEVVSWRPRAFIYHNFMTDEEADHIKRLAAPLMKRSTVVGANGSSVLDDYRTSYGTFIKRKADGVIEDIEARVAKWARIPPVHAEDIQVLRYGLGQQYKQHMDTLQDEVSGPRVCTVLLYLNDVPKGGETAFPDSNNWVDPILPGRMGPFSPCAQGHVAFKPKKGDALMFWSIKPDGKREDPFSMHTGCPVLEGVKWTATLWIHARPFRPDTWGDKRSYDIDPGLCQDTTDSCEDWANKGECQRNAGYMMGDVGNPGHCPRACGVCKPCKDGDRACYNENRRRAGFLVYSEGDLDAEVFHS